MKCSSEVVGRPLAALLANDGARVLSVDIDCLFLSDGQPHQERAKTACSQPSWSFRNDPQLRQGESTTLIT